MEVNFSDCVMDQATGKPLPECIMSEPKLRVLPDKMIALVALSVYVVYILGLSNYMIPVRLITRQRLSEIVIALHLLCFFGFFVFFPRKGGIIKGVVLCAIIPLICCMMVYTTYHVVYIIEWKLPLFLRSERGLGDFLFNIIDYSGLVPYLTLCVWAVSFALLLVFGICIYLSRGYAHRPEIDALVQQKIKITRPERIKFILLMVAIYIAFAIAYVFVLKIRWGGYCERITEYGVPVYVFSFFSIIYLVPFIVNNIKKAILCCLAIPFFWPVFTGLIYAVLVLFYTPEVPKTWFSPGMPLFYSYSGIPFFSVEDVLTLRFYLVRYLDTQAWFISFPLMAVWCAYRWRANKITAN